MKTETYAKFKAAIADFVVQPRGKQVLALEGMVAAMEAEHGPCEIETNPVNDWFTIRFADDEQINVSVREDMDEFPDVEERKEFPWLIIQ